MRANQELSDIVLALGCGTGASYREEALRYERVVIMTDADVDGAHIASLLMTFFFREMATLVDNGHLFLALPPLYRMTQGEVTHYARDDAHREALMETAFKRPRQGRDQPVQGARRDAGALSARDDDGSGAAHAPPRDAAAARRPLGDRDPGRGLRAHRKPGRDADGPPPRTAIRLHPEKRPLRPRPRPVDRRSAATVFIFAGKIRVLLSKRRTRMSRTKCFAIVASVAVITLGAATGRAQQQPPQAPNMTFFVTTAGLGKGADLGGLDGADRQCQALAQAAGAGGKTWRAYLSTQAVDGAAAVNARDRIGRGPWQNFKAKLSRKASTICIATIITQLRDIADRAWHHGRGTRLYAELSRRIDWLAGGWPDLPARGGQDLPQLDEQHHRRGDGRPYRPQGFARRR